MGRGASPLRTLVRITSRKPTQEIMEANSLSSGESDDADRHLLVDWKGDGGAAMVQQKLPFKQVKPRLVTKTTTTFPSKSAAEIRPTSAPQLLPKESAAYSTPDVKDQSIVLVSLSDSEPSKPCTKPKGSNDKPPEQPPDAVNVVCLDSDTDSEGSVVQWGLKTCRNAPNPEITPVERIIVKSEANPQLPAENSYPDFDECVGSPRRATSGDRNCTLDPFGSGGTSLEVDGPIVSSTSKRPDSSQRIPEGGGQSIEGESHPSYFNDDDDLGFLSPITEVGCRGPALTLHNKRDFHLNDAAQRVSNRNLESELQKAQDGDGAPVGGIPKKRRVGKPISEEEKELDRNEKLRAKEVERLRKAKERAEKKRQKEEDKKKLQEENRRKREEEKVRKEAAKEEAKGRRKLEHEKNRWEKGKFALENTRALIDTKVVEKGVIGGHLLNKLAEKQLQFQLVCNPFPRSIVWRMKRPSADCPGEAEAQFWDAEDTGVQTEGPISQLVLEEVDVPYVLLVLEAEEFAAMIGDNTLHKHICSVQAKYPGFTVCYLINKLKWYLNKKDQTQYKNGESGWKRPPVEQTLARLLTHYSGVHSRLCLDEAEVAEHITGLMRSLADCPFKPKLTSLSVSKNGDHVTKSGTFKEEIKKSLWLKALVALPRVPGSCALAIAKEYRNMRSLLNAYLDCSKTVHQKELLLQDLIREGILGPEQQRRVGPACSRRIYRILMAQNGNLKTDDVEEGADHFDNSD